MSIDQKQITSFYGLRKCPGVTTRSILMKKRVLGPSRVKLKDSKTSFEKNCFSAWASTLNMGLINKVDMVCLSPVGYGV